MLKLEDYIADWNDIDFPNFLFWMRYGRETWPERIALRYRAGKSKEFDEWTYRRLCDEAESVARALVTAGCADGDRVALWSENRPEWCAVWLGAVISGCVIVPLDATITGENASDILVKTEAKVLVASPHKADWVDRFRANCPALAAVAVFDRDYRDFLASAPDGVKIPEPETIASDHAASIIFTSGTTGIAKGVTLSHHGIIANINASILSLPIYDRDVFMGVLPLHHTYPTTCAFLSPLSVGGSLTICERIVGKVIIDDIRDSGGTIVIGVPLLYDKLMVGLRQGFRAKGPIVSALVGTLCGISRFFRVALHCHSAGEVLLSGIRKQAGLGTIRLLVAGGGALDPATADFFDDLGFNIVQGYGMSENGPLITTNTVKYKNNKSAGLVVKYTDIRITGANEEGVGEIEVRSPSLMKGYFRNPEATADVFTADGYLKTGDLGYLDRDGFLFITGRRKNLIVTAGGKNIYPEEIEAKFAGNPLVEEVLVMPRKGPKGEEIAAVFVVNAVVIKEKYDERAEDAAFVEALIRDEVQRVNRSLVSYQKIASWGIRAEEFERTATNKVKRFLYHDYDAALGKKN
jgi:long-chain acyl-CoA synthetase